MHTQGPWKRGVRGDASQIVTDDQRQQRTIAEVRYYGYERQEIAANACLLAAAPSLLVALDELVLIFEGLLDGEEISQYDSLTLQLAYNALIKARGKNRQAGKKGI